MFCAIPLVDRLNVMTFVEGLALKTNGKSLQRLGTRLRGIVGNCGGVKSSAQPHPNRHIGCHLLSNRLLQKAVQFLACLAKTLRNRRCYSRRKEGIYPDPPLMPLQAMARHQLGDPFHERVRTRNVIETQEAIQPIEIDAPRHPWMGKDAFQLGTEEDLTILQAIIERLDSHAIAGQDQTPLRFIPDGQAEHAAETGERRSPPFHEGMQHNFGVTARPKALSQTL